ncbi:helix-turn-helix domain-containing protein [Streptomyces sp. NPDC047515]|uniref:helix-turn-helix domain-containing protein n=1 Tax=Streptomyces sp. NPDC047515 TaxID=3155380 RepID=UPI00340F4FEB
MAMNAFVPYRPASDLMTLKECVELLKPTGHPVSKSTISRWIRRDGIPVERQGGIYVPFSDVLMAHQEYVASRRRR